MSIFERVRSIAALAAILFAACDAPAAPTPPEADSLGLHLLMALDARWSQQFLVVAPPDGGFTPVGAVEAAMYMVPEDGPPIAVAQGEALDPSSDCLHAFLTTFPLCIEFDFVPTPGATYRVEVEAEGRPTATATALVPGEFDIIGIQAEGTPSGTEGVAVEWTPSRGAYGYFVGVFSLDAPRCVSATGCEDGWFVATQETTLHGRIPNWVFEKGPGPWYVVVTALDRGLYEFLTTGSGGSLFSVPPIQNVENGSGVVGAWSVDAVPLDQSG